MAGNKSYRIEHSIGITAIALHICDIWQQFLGCVIGNRLLFIIAVINLYYVLYSGDIHKVTRIVCFFVRLYSSLAAGLCLCPENTYLVTISENIAATLHFGVSCPVTIFKILSNIRPSGRYIGNIEIR